MNSRRRYNVIQLIWHLARLVDWCWFSHDLHCDLHFLPSWIFFSPTEKKAHEVQGQSSPRLPRVALKHPGCVHPQGIACLRDRNLSVPFFGSWRCGQDVEMWGFDLRYVRWQGNMVEKLKAWKMWQITCGLECWNYVGRKMWTRAIVGIVESLWKEQTFVFLVGSMPFVGARIPTNTQLVTQSWNRSSLLPFTPVHPTFSYRNGFAFSDIGASFFHWCSVFLTLPSSQKTWTHSLQDEEKHPPTM